MFNLLSDNTEQKINVMWNKTFSAYFQQFLARKSQTFTVRYM